MAIYQSKFLSPYNTTIDGTAINLFSFTCQGSTITKYNAKAYRVSDNVQVYTTGDVVLSPVKYNNDIVTFNIPATTFTNGTQYKWDVVTYEGASSATSFQVTFWANATATITMTVPAIITSQSYTFTGTYSQANNVPIQYFYFVLSDATGEIERTDLEFSGNITHKFEGFVSDNNYDIQIFGVTANGALVQSPLYNFDVLYSKPSVLISPEITQDCDTSLVTILWDDIVSIIGTPTGDISYVEGLVESSSYTLRLEFGESVDWDFNIPIDFTASFLLRILPTTTGVLVQLKDGYYFGYENNKFFVIINGTKITSDSEYPNNSSRFLIVLRPTEFTVTEIPMEIIVASFIEGVELLETKLEVLTVEYQRDIDSMPLYDVDGLLMSVGVASKEVII